MALCVLGALSAWPSATAESRQTLDTDVLVLSEDFEASPVARGWTVVDDNLYNGTDSWSNTTYRAYAGNSSAWSAASGLHSGTYTIFSEDFEGSLTGWTFQDRNTSTTRGLDYWGPSGYRFHGGATSLWSAQVGTNSLNSNQPNENLHMYDNDMNSTATRSVNVAGYSDITISYWFWTNAELNWDGLYLMFFDGAWHYENAKNGPQGGAGWQFTSYALPSTVSQVGFLFTSDGSVIMVGGSYIDDVLLTGTRTDANRDIHRYDDGMDARLEYPLDLTAYASARLEYRYWLDSEAPNDTLEAAYLIGDTWTYTDVHSGTTQGWQVSTVALPPGTLGIGFKFHSDALGQREGAYIDDLRVWGVVTPLNCTAESWDLVGMEVVSALRFAGIATGGLRPYTWTWSFGDGDGATVQQPSHVFDEVGTYEPTLTVQDSIGQTCTARPPAVRVDHDTTRVSVSPLFAEVAEGSSLVAFGRDGQAHPYPVDWELNPTSCGVLNRTVGESVLFTALQSAGGESCTLTGRVGPVRSTLRISVLQDTSIITITPQGGDVVEGGGLRLSAADRYGGELPFVWTTTCGRVAYGPSTFTFFEGVIDGGVFCDVSARYGDDKATVRLFVLHDTGTVTVSPDSATLVEGSTQAFSVVDRFDHAFDGAWSVEPSSCGAFSIEQGASTLFTAATDAGGTECVVAALGGGHRVEIPVSVRRDLRDAVMVPSSATIAQGGSQSFTFANLYGHPLVANWSLSPAACGSLDHLEAATVTLTVGADAGGSTCTLGASGFGLNKYAGITVQYGAPTTVVVFAGAGDVLAGGSATVSAQVRDNVGHHIPDLAVEWTTTCGGVSPAKGTSTTVSAPGDAAGTTCTVTAAHGELRASAAIQVRHVGPFTLLVMPPGPSVGAGSTQQFTATVLDRDGRPVNDATVSWKATCGDLSSTTGLTVTYTAPSSLGGQNCAVTASLGGSSVAATTSVQAGASPVIPIALLGVAGAAVALFVVMRMRRAAATARAAKALEAPVAAPLGTDLAATAEAAAAEPAPASAAGVCPRCESPVEAGWATCAECGAPLQ